MTTCAHKMSSKLPLGRYELRRRHKNCLKYHIKKQIGKCMNQWLDGVMWNKMPIQSNFLGTFLPWGFCTSIYGCRCSEWGKCGTMQNDRKTRNETQEWDGGTEGQNILKCHKTWQNVTAMKMFCFLKWWIINMFICL